MGRIQVLRTSDKARFLLEVLGSYPEGIHSIIRKPGEEDGQRKAREARGGFRGEPTELEELDGRGHPERFLRLLFRELQRQQALVGDIHGDAAHTTKAWCFVLSWPWGAS